MITNDTDFRPWLNGALCATITPPAVAGIYALCAFLTHARTGSAALVLPFEQHIPLVTWFVIPYLSLHLLVVIAFFFCQEMRAQWRLSLAMVFAALLCACAFLSFPIRVAYAPPTGEGAMLRAIRGIQEIDADGNRFPSLHVALTLLIWPPFARIRRIRPFANCWMILMLASTLLTHQHHVVDVAGGAIVALLAAWLSIAVMPRTQINCSRRRTSRIISSAAPGPNSQNAAVHPNATPVQVPRSQ
jgi:membrane-associated phospholipid phosphatase